MISSATRRDPEKDPGLFMQSDDVDGLPLVVFRDLDNLQRLVLLPELYGVCDCFYSFASAALAETINPRRFTSTRYPSSSLMTK